MNSPVVVLWLTVFAVVVTAGCVRASNANSVRRAVASLLDQLFEVEGTVSELRISLTQLRHKYDALVASASVATETHERLRRGVVLKLEHLKVLTLGSLMAVSTGDEETPLQRRGMSEACVDTVDHALSVRGVCSCAHGLLVEGRNVTQELDAALGVVSEASTDRAATTDVAASTLSTPNCTLSNNASVVGGVINTTFLNGAYGIALTPDEKYAVATGYLSDSLAIINITDPTHPSIVGGLLVADLQLDAPTTVVVSPNGQYAFVGALQSNELVVVDIATDVTKPSVAGRFTARSPLGVTTFDGEFVYLSSYNNPTLTVVNVSDPTNPTGSGTISDIQSLSAGFWMAMSKDGNFVYVPSAADAFAVVDVSDPSEPTVVGSYRDSLYMKHAVDVAVSPNGQLAFVSLYYGGLTVINVTDPTSPTRIGFMPYSTYNQGVTVSPDGKYVFLAAINSIITIDVHSDIAVPKIVGSITHNAYYEGREIAVSSDGNSLFVASYTGKAILTVEWGSCRGGTFNH